MSKVSKKVKEAFVQYSKRMCTRVTFFWMLYRLANFIVVLLRPEVAKYLVDLCTGIDTVMIINIGFYTGNSLGEKAVIAFGKRKSLYNSDDDEKEEKDEESEKESEEENG